MNFKEPAKNTIGLIYGVSISCAILYVAVSFFYGDDAFQYLIENSDSKMINNIEVLKSFLGNISDFAKFGIVVYIYSVILWSFFIMMYPIILLLQYYGLNGSLKNISFTKFSTKNPVHPLLKGVYSYIGFIFFAEMIVGFIAFYAIVDYFAYPSISLVYLAIGLVVYLLPSIIASERKHNNFISIILTNLLLGVTVKGWIVALIWSTTNPQKVTIVQQSPNN